jgi:uncharacterized protein YjbI with pentapeptide repeats
MNPPRTSRELLDRYRQGERNFRGAELDQDPNCDFTGACLDGVDLSESWITASFRGASLRGAHFVRANVKTCDFRNADLTGADFRGAALCAAQFSGAITAGIRLEGSFYHSRTFRDGDVPGW